VHTVLLNRDTAFRAARVGAASHMEALQLTAKTRGLKQTRLIDFHQLERQLDVHFQAQYVGLSMVQSPNYLKI